MTALAVATLETDLSGALELGGRALSFAEAQQRPVLASASFHAEALVLGALQREDTLRQRSPARFDVARVRRLTTGTEAQLSGPALYHALALPRVDALFPDASPRTLLNRNLRAFLRGYTAAGAPLRYFGTEVLALLGHPVALIGYDRVDSGTLLIEVLVGLEHACVVRPALKRELPAALLPLLRTSVAPHEYLRRIVAGIVERHGVGAEDVAGTLLAQPTRAPTEPASGVVPASVSIPLGVVEAVARPELELTGDLLASTAALTRFARAVEASGAAGEPPEAARGALEGSPLDGARLPDLVQVIHAALAG